MMGRTARSGNAACTPRVSGSLTPSEVDIFYHDIPQLLHASPLFSDKCDDSQASISPEDAVNLYVRFLLSHLPDLLRPGRELLALYHTVCRISRILNLLREVSELHEELSHRVDVVDIVERAVAPFVMVADLAVTIRSLTPYLREIVRLFEDRASRARRASGRARLLGQRRRRGRSPEEDSEDWTADNLDGGDPLEERVVRTMVQLLYSELMLVVAYHELVAATDE